MKDHIVLFFILLLSLTSAFAQSVYCPQKAGFIQPGMSQADVLKKCGPPSSKSSENTPVIQRIPVTQFIYNNLNTGSVYPELNSAFYEQWSLPSGSQGIMLEVDLVNNKIDNIRLNGSDTNAATICNGGNMQIGGDVAQVYRACGAPSMVNTTYVEREVPSEEKPEVWIYRTTPYQPSLRLTFINGRLESVQ